MSQAFYGPKTALDRKPGHGQPCNGCGLCCMAAPCSLSRFVFDIDRGTCPALVEVSKHTYACGFTMNQVIPENLREAAKVIVRAGQGCDARFNGEPINHEFNVRLDKLDALDHQKIMNAKNLWTEAKQRKNRTCEPLS